MRIGGWISSLNRRTIKAKKDKSKGRPEPLTALYFTFLKCKENSCPGIFLWDEQANIDIEYVVLYCLQVLCAFSSVSGFGFPPFVTYHLSALHPAEALGASER